MNCKVLTTSLLFLSLSHLPAYACTPGDPRSTNYILRDSNRCEGIQPINAAGSLRLISLSSRSISNFGANLTLQIPRIGNNNKPLVNVRSLGKNYQLDNLVLASSSSKFTFTWSTYVLTREKIPPSSLRALAFTYFSSSSGSPIIYIPVILGQPSGKYEFVVIAPNRAKFPTFEIRRRNQVVHSSPRHTFQPAGEIFFIWDGRNADGRKAAAGQYELRIIGELEQRGGAPQKIVMPTITFEHNPNWLR